jgi:hypothetical protein
VTSLQIKEILLQILLFFHQVATVNINLFQTFIWFCSYYINNFAFKLHAVICTFKPLIHTMLHIVTVRQMAIFFKVALYTVISRYHVSRRHSRQRTFRQEVGSFPSVAVLAVHGILAEMAAQMVWAKAVSVALAKSAMLTASANSAIEMVSFQREKALLVALMVIVVSGMERAANRRGGKVSVSPPRPRPSIVQPHISA